MNEQICTLLNMIARDLAVAIERERRQRPQEPRPARFTKCAVKPLPLGMGI